MSPTRETLRLALPTGPLVADVWTPPTPSNRTPIVLVHGWGNSGGYWASTAEALAHHTRVIVPDLPGTGRSQPVQRPHDMYDQVAALETLLDELDLPQVHLVGHSMGSAMSLLLSERAPQRIDRLVITSMCFFLNDGQRRTYRTVMNMLYLTMRLRWPWMINVPGLAEMMGRRYFHHLPSDPTVLKQGFDDYLTLDFRTAVACAQNACDHTIPTAGKLLQSPALLIACREDNVMPVANVDYTTNTIPNCELRWIDDCGHMPMVEKPAEYVGILREFLQLPHSAPLSERTLSA